MTAPSPSLPCVPDLVAAEGRTPVNHSKHACSCQLSAQVRAAPSGAHTREGKVWLQPALPSLPHCFSAALSDQAGEMSVPGHSHGTCCPGNGITLLVTVTSTHRSWLLLLGWGSSPHRINRTGGGWAVQAATVPRGHPPGAGACLTAVCFHRGFCAESVFASSLCSSQAGCGCASTRH